MAKIKILFLETRPQFLILSVVLSFLGTSLAWYDGYFNAGFAILSAVGLIFSHVSVNVLNDYFDYRSGIDLNTNRTPFSGGSGILPQALLKPVEVFYLGIGSFFLASIIGVYFVLTRGWLLFPLLFVAALCVFLYTPFILRTKYPEWAAGLGLGLLPVMGTYFVQSAGYTFAALIASVPSGILVHNLLMLNELPDVEADKKGGRETLPIVVGKKRAGIVYSILTLLVYAWIIAGIALGFTPVFCLISLLSFPVAVKAIKGALNPDKQELLMTAMAANVLVIMLIQILLGLGYILSGFF
jgi:1,4-dihydroxy-2-naphthoate octaprenyltransferase